MNKFAELLDRLAYEPGRNNKLRLIADYFRTTPDPERGFALAALTGALSFRHAKAGVIRALIAERTDPVPCFASGWMRVRARARQRGVELPLVISDHADWDGLTATIEATGAREVWVTHGQEDALVHWCQSKGLAARPLDLVGYGDEDESDGTTDNKTGEAP